MKLKGVLVIIALSIIPALVYFGFNYHFILLDDGVRMLKKNEMNLEYTIVDGRGPENTAKILTNPTLLKAGIRNLLSGEGITIRPKEKLEKTYQELFE